MKTNFIIKDIDLLTESGLFKEKILEKGEMLFDVGDIDNNLYIIIDGYLSVGVYTNPQRTRIKELAKLEEGNFTGEGALINNEPKKAFIKAVGVTKVMYIDIENDLDKLFETKPRAAKNLLVQILAIEHERINNLNFYISANYEINTLIKAIEKINKKAIFKVIEGFKDIIVADRILYVERDSNMTNIIKVTYDTNFKGKIQTDKVYEKNETKNIIELKELFEENGINENDNIYINDISLGNEIMGFFILTRKDYSFSDNEQKVISNITNVFGGVVKQYNNQKDEQNKEYLMQY